MAWVLGSSFGDAILTATKQTPAFMLLLRNLQPLLPPEPQDSLFVHLPAFPTQQRPYSPVAVAGVVSGEFTHPGS